MPTTTQFTYRIVYERIGRHRNVPDQVFDAPDGEAAVDQVYDYVNRHLGSRWFSLSMYEDGEGSIGGGRFGKFTWTREPTRGPTQATAEDAS